MRRVEFVTVDVFTARRFGGNPLAVFPHAAGLADAEMQAIAREFNLSETTFVLPPEDPAHTARVRIFTPLAELPFAGHPNVGTGFVLARQMEEKGGVAPERLVFEEAAGLVPIELRRDAQGRAQGATLTAPQPLSTGAQVPADAIAACAGLRAEDIRIAAHPPLWAGVGVGFVIAEVAGREALARAAPDTAAFRAAASRLPELRGDFGLHLYAMEPDDRRRLHTRMFAPLLGVAEDPATGSANAALAALLVSLSAEAEGSFEIEQGVEMGRPSLLAASARREADGGVRARIGGGCVPVMRGELEL